MDVMVANKLDSSAAGISLASVLGGLYVLCLLVFYALPEAYVGIGRSMFHGVALASGPVGLPAALSGLAGWLSIGFAIGWVFAWVYNQRV